MNIELTHRGNSEILEQNVNTYITGKTLGVVPILWASKYISDLTLCQFSLFTVVMLYKVGANTELANTESLL